jgi:hypothetical protein
MKWSAFKQDIHDSWKRCQDTVVRVRDIQLRGLPQPDKSAALISLPIKAGNSVITQATRQGMKSLLERVGVPFSFFNKCSPQLASEVLKEFLAKQQSKSLLLRTLRSSEHTDHTLRFAGSPKYDIYNDADVVEALDEYVGDDTKVQRINRGYDRTSFMIALGTEPLKVLREFTLGLRIMNSETGCSSFRIELIIFELMCTNGLILPKKIFPAMIKAHLMRDDHQHNIKAFMDVTLPQLRIINAKIKYGMSELAKAPAEQIFAQIRENKRIPTVIQGYIEAALPHYGTTALDAISAITEIARDVESVDTQDYLQTLAGELAFTDQ